jgi:hypothetical protein
MTSRLLLYGALLAAALVLLPKAFRRIPEAQLRLSGPLNVEEMFSHSKFSLVPGQIRELAASLDFDGAKSDCVLNGSVWKITDPSNPKLSLTIQEGCDMEFDGWVHVRGGPSGADRIMLRLDPEISARMNGAHCESLGDRIVFHDIFGKQSNIISASQKETAPSSEGMRIVNSDALLGCHSGQFAAVIHANEQCDEGCETLSAVLDFHAADGHLLWTKKMLPLEMVAPLSGIMSRNDARIWYISKDTGKGPAAVALSSDGKERVFKFEPGTFLGTVRLAHNGQYARIDVRPQTGESYFRFYDLDTGKSHDFPMSDTHESLSPQLNDDGLIEIWKGSIFFMNQTCRRDCVLTHRFQF